MTGASAERFEIRGTGVLQTGHAGDTTVFDWKNVEDANTEKRSNARPDRIGRVSISGRQVVDGEKIESTADTDVVV